MGRRAVLLPAAGASSRMRGRDKLLEDVGGEPCLRVLAQRAFQSADRVIVTLPSQGHPRADALRGLPVEILVVPDAHEGMSSSLRAGAQAAQDDDLMILPADMPALRAQDLGQMWEAFEALSPPAILRAKAENGALGHPVLFASGFLEGFTNLTGDEGAASILRAHPEQLHFHHLEGTRAILDLDTPEDWAQWRQTWAAKE